MQAGREESHAESRVLFLKAHQVQPAVSARASSSCGDTDGVKTRARDFVVHSGRVDF